MFRSLVDRLNAALARLRTRNIHHCERNELVIADSPNDVLMGCCDCGLFHRFDFYHAPDGKFVIRGRRDHVATADARLAQTFPFQHYERTRVERFEDRVREDVARSTQRAG